MFAGMHHAADFLLINSLIAILQPQSNGPSYSNAMIGKLAVDGWIVTFGTARTRRGLAGAAARPGRGRIPPRPLLAVPNVTAHPSTPVYQIRIIRYSTIAFGV